MVVTLDPVKTEDIATEIQNLGSCLSELLLESETQTFRFNKTTGFIGFVTISRFAVVIGDPVCQKEDIEILTDEFHKFAKENNLEIIYFGVSESFAKLNFPNKSKVKIQAGNELIYDPFDNPLMGPKGSRLRNKIQFAKKRGITFHEYYLPNIKTEEALNQLVETWGKLRNGPQLYLGDVQLFNLREGRRWFYVKDGERYLGVALLKQMDAKDGWLLKYHLVLQDVPRGTSELLLVSILEALKEENCHFLTYGIMPMSELSEIEGLGTISKNLARLFFKLTKWFFNLESRKAFWEKFQPISKPVYILLSSSKFTVSQVYALMKILKMKF